MGCFADGRWRASRRPLTAARRTCDVPADTTIPTRELRAKALVDRAGAPAKNSYALVANQGCNFKFDPIAQLESIRLIIHDMWVRIRILPP